MEMDVARIAAAMAMALQQSHDESRGSLSFAFPDAWLDAGVRAVAYDQPTGPDPHGFLAIGEVQDRPSSRTGFVLLHPATESVRITWVNDAAPRNCQN